MSAMASQITIVSIVFSIVCSGVDRRKHQSSASLTFVWEIHRSPVDALHKEPVTRKMFHLMTSSCTTDMQRWIRLISEKSSLPEINQSGRCKYIIPKYVFQRLCLWKLGKETRPWFRLHREQMFLWMIFLSMKTGCNIQHKRGSGAKVKIGKYFVDGLCAPQCEVFEFEFCHWHKNDYKIYKNVETVASWKR